MPAALKATSVECPVVDSRKLIRFQGVGFEVDPT